MAEKQAKNKAVQKVRRMVVTTCDSCGKEVKRRPGYDPLAWIMCAACKRDMGAAG